MTIATDCEDGRKHQCWWGGVGFNRGEGGGVQLTCADAKVVDIVNNIKIRRGITSGTGAITITYQLHGIGIADY